MSIEVSIETKNARSSPGVFRKKENYK